MPFLEELRRHIHRILLGQGRDFDQQRRHSRILASVPVVLERETESLPGVLVDLSLDGARVQMAAKPNRLRICRPPFRRGQKLSLILAYGAARRPERSVTVTVRWVRPSTAGWDIGLQLMLGDQGGWVSRLLNEYGLSHDAFQTRRNAARATTRQKIKVSLGLAQDFPGELLDLSLGGACITCEKAFARFVPVRLTLQLAGEMTELPAQVVHVRPYRQADLNHQQLWLFGVRFGELSRDQGEAVGRHLVESRRPRS